MIENPVKTQCSTPTCSPSDDATTCCKPAPPALCSTITSPGTFCANDGNNGLINNAGAVSCIKPTCTIVADAARCCKAALNAAKCDSIQNPTSFCASVGSSGLVANPGTVTCLTSTCSNTTSTDVDKCCKPCAAGRFLNWKTNVCDPCEIGQFSTVGSSACLSSCPAGYGADVTVPIYMNVFFMLDMTGSVCEQWVEEVETAEEYCTLLFLQYLIKHCGMCVLTLLFSSSSSLPPFNCTYSECVQNRNRNVL